MNKLKHVLNYLYEAVIVDTFTPLIKDLKYSFSPQAAQDEVDRMEKTRLYLCARYKIETKKSGDSKNSFIYDIYDYLTG